MALLAAHHGKRTLVGEVDAKGNLADFYEVGDTSFEPREISTNLYAMSMHTEESLKEYLRLQLKIPVLARIGPLARTFDFVAQAAPGVKEVLTVGKFLWETRASVITTWWSSTRPRRATSSRNSRRRSTSVSW